MVKKLVAILENPERTQEVDFYLRLYDNQSQQSQAKAFHEAVGKLDDHAGNITQPSAIMP